MKRIITALLSIILIFILAFSLSSCTIFEDYETVVGKITYVTKAYNDKDLYIYLLPCDSPENSEWILFKADADVMESLNFDRSNINELVGKTVEIKFDMGRKSSGGDGKCYSANEIIEVAGGSNPSYNTDLTLLVNEKYLSEFDGGDCGAIGEIKHVAFVNASVKGYIVYIDEGSYILSAYFFDENARIDDDVMQLFEAGEIDATVIISGRMAYPFYNRNIRKGSSIYLYSN